MKQMVFDSPRFWYSLSAEDCLFLVRAEGELTDEALIRFFEFLYQHPDWRPGVDELVDFRRATGRGITPSAIRRMAHLSKELEAPKKTALVAEGQLSFGLLRMFMTYADDSPEEIRIFENLSDACAWLGYQEHQLQLDLIAFASQTVSS